MKVLFCTNAFENTTNGPAKFANLILEINRLPLHTEVRILTEDVSKDTPMVYKAELNISKWLKPLGQFIRMFSYNAQAEKIYQQYPFDVLIYNNAFIGLVSALRKKYQTIGMINDDNNLDARLKDLFAIRYKAKRFIFRIFEKWSAHEHGLIISNSNYLTEKLISGYKLNPQKIRRMYKAIDTSKVIPKQVFTLDEKNIRILFVKNDYQRGGITTLRDALKLLNEYNYHLTIAGPETFFKTKIINLFKEVTHVKVDFLGPCSQAEVLSLFQKNDIFCVPSLKEALGVANIEAMASGICVVTSNAGGIPEIMKNGQNGWLAEAGDPESLATSLKEAITNEEARNQKRQRALDTIQEFNSQSMYLNFVNIISEYLDKNE